MAFIEDCLKRKIIFIAGKGGVGKTTIAWATALSLKPHVHSVAVLGWSPFTDNGKTDTVSIEGISFIPLETFSALREYILHILKFDRLYEMVFNNKLFHTFVRVAPGLAETVAAGKVWNLYHQKVYDLLIVDLPSTGHAISFFRSPIGIERLFDVGFVHKEAEKIIHMFRSHETRIDLVTLPEELPVNEVFEFKENLHNTVSMNFGFTHLNRVTPMFDITPNLDSEKGQMRNVLEVHLYDLQQQQTMQRRILEINLPVIEIPIFTHSNWLDRINAVAQHLQNA